jgi:hypothetical protein
MAIIRWALLNVHRGASRYGNKIKFLADQHPALVLSEQSNVCR